MDSVARNFQDRNWTYADDDPEALEEIRRRVQETARSGKETSYSKVASGVEFDHPHINGGSPYQMDVNNLSQNDIRILSDYLGRISADSYLKAGFMASAVVVRKDTGRPGPGFFRLARDVGLLSGETEETEETFWREQVRKARRHY